MPYLILAILTCILAPPLVGYAIKKRRQQRADLDDADPDFCGWYDEPINPIARGNGRAFNNGD